MVSRSGCDSLATASLLHAGLEEVEVSGDQRSNSCETHSEYATVKTYLHAPASTRFRIDGTGQEKWEMAGRDEMGRRARIGDMVQVDDIDIDKNSITLVITTA